MPVFPIIDSKTPAHFL